MTSFRIRLAALAALLFAPLGALPAQAEDAPALSDDRPALLLMGTVPIYWGEAEAFTDLVRGGADPHWARPLLEQHYRLVPLDALSSDRLGRNPFLLMAQPRTLLVALTGRTNTSTARPS